MRKRRSLTLSTVLTAVVAMLAVMFGASPAYAAKITTSGSFSAPAMNSYGDTASFSGDLDPGCSGRPISLYRNGVWHAGTTTGANGYWSIVNVSNPGGGTFHVYSAGFDCGADRHTSWRSGNDKYVAPYTPPTYGSSYTLTSTPEYTSSGDQNVTVTGVVNGACAGRPVSLYREDGASNTYIAGTTTDGAGNFAITFNVGYVADYHFYSAQQDCGTAIYQGTTSASFKVKSLRLWDGFDYTSVGDASTPGTLLGSGKWSLRQTAYGLGGRDYMKAGPEGLGVGGGTLKLKVTEDTANPDKFIVGHITNGIPAAGSPMDFVNGHLEARIKFHRPTGAHGSFWHTSGYTGGQGEIDVVEWFGETGSNPGGSNPESQKIQHTLHNADGQFAHFAWTDEIRAGGATNGTDYALNGAAGPNDTFWSSFHTFEAHWKSDKITYYIDGINIGSVQGSGVSGTVTPTVAGEAILSNLVNNGEEYQDLLAHLAGGGSEGDYTTEVDWVRVWR